jgi:hypothetical protein
VTFEVFYRQGSRTGTPFIRFDGETLLQLSHGAVALWSHRPKRVQLLFDRDRRIVGIRPADDNNGAAYILNRAGQVSCMGFQRFIGQAVPSGRISVRIEADGMLTADLP